MILPMISAVTYPQNDSYVVSCRGSCPLNPDATGTYYLNGTYNGLNSVSRADGSYHIWYYNILGAYLISTSKGSYPGSNDIWYDGLNLAGNYDPEPLGTYTGQPTVSFVSGNTIYDCGTITSSGTYTLNQSLSGSGNCLNITSDNVTIDGNGFTITGDNTENMVGIFSDGYNNVTIKNLNITKYYFGIQLNNMNTANINNMNFSSDALAIEINNADNVTVSNSIFDSLSYDALHVFQSESGYFNNLKMNKASNAIEVSGNGYHTFSNILISNDKGNGIVITSSSNIFNNINISNSVYQDIVISGDANYISSCYITSGHDNGIRIDSGSNNILYNINSYNNTNFAIFDGRNVKTTSNYLIFNNSFGEIRWTSPILLKNMTVRGDLTWQGNVKLSNNLAYVNSTALTGNINSPANITLRGIPTNFVTPTIYKDGVKCTDCTLYSYSGGVAIFGVTSWSEYSIGEAPPPIIRDELSRTFVKILLGFLSLIVFFTVLGLLYLSVRTNFAEMTLEQAFKYFVVIIVATALYITLINYVMGLL